MSLTVDQISYKYREDGKQILKDISFQIDDGEIACVVGPSGCGKSTLGEIISGVIPNLISNGILEGSFELPEPDKYSVAVGVVSQSPENQLFGYGVEDAIVFGLENRGFPSELIAERLEFVLDLLNIQHLRFRSVSTLSGGQRQAVIPIHGIAEHFTPRCLCPCLAIAEQRRRETEEQRKRIERIRRRREQGLQDRHLYNYTFANDNGQNPLMEKARAYVDGWDKAYTSNTGLLLFGDVGTGKSFFAGCIANALLDRDVSVMMTNFPTILSRLTGMFPEERIDYIDSIGRYDLLILDDLGVERNTSYAMEQMFQVVDRRYRSCKPLIVTTNLSLEQMKNAPDVEHSRIYGRILEYCAPILFSGKDMRKNNADTTKTTAREILSTKTTL